MLVFTFYFSRQMTFIMSTLFNIRPTFIFCGRFICRKKQRSLQDSGLDGLGRLITVVLHCLYTEWTSSTVQQDTNQILSVANTQRRVLIIYGSFSGDLPFALKQTYSLSLRFKSYFTVKALPDMASATSFRHDCFIFLRKQNLHAFDYVYFSQQGAQRKEKRICCRLCPLLRGTLAPPPRLPSFRQCV